MKAKLLKWLGPGWRIQTIRVDAANWRKPNWRGEYLCQQAIVDRFHVADESEGDKRVVYFAIWVG